MTLPHTAEKLINNTMTASDVMRAWMESVDKNSGIIVATGAELADISSSINTVGKYQFKQVINSGTYLIMISLGSDASSAWQPSDGSSQISPS